MSLFDEDRREGLVAILAVERLDRDHFVTKLIVSLDGKADVETAIVHTIEEVHAMADRMASALYHLTRTVEKKEGEKPKLNPIKDKDEKKFNN